LVPTDSNGKNDLYEARIGCPATEPDCEESRKEVTSLTEISKDNASNQAAEVIGVVNMAPDGGAVYFVAHGALTSSANSEGESAVPGADNLYAYDTRDDRLVFVADLCSASAASGTTEDTNCPASSEADKREDTGLWGASDETQVTDDGRFLIFTSFGRLVRRAEGADTDAHKDVYRFDISSDALERVSIGEEGYDANGNSEADSSILPGGYQERSGNGTAVFLEHEMSLRTVSNDGSWIAFSTAEPLSPHVSNGLLNDYIWHAEKSGGGRVSLISSGSSLTDDLEPIIPPNVSPEGRDVFFTTSAGLVSGDTENDLDVYDARIGGGFVESTVDHGQCSSDACQGPLTAPTSLLVPAMVPASMSQAPGENWPRPKKQKKAKTGKKVRHRHKAKRRHAVKGKSGTRPKVSHRRVGGIR
jgi:hypothetical protein